MKRSILDAVGSPLVQVQSPVGATVAAKLEAFNPGGSAKDRPALAMVETAERTGALTPGDRIVEPTSGNTGIGLAVVAAARDYNLTIVMPASKSMERRRLLRAYGADLELVDGDMDDARDRAKEIAASEDAVLLHQFANNANPRAHYEQTAEEILDAVGDREIDAFVAGIGTGGTITGTATRLKEEFPELTVVGIEPEQNAVLTTGKPGDDDFQGMGPGFVSDILDLDLLDDVQTVGIKDAEEECRRLAREEGVLVGQSSGAASLVAQSVAADLAQPELNCPDPLAAADGGEYDDCPLVVTVFPDSGERYLSTGVFD